MNDRLPHADEIAVPSSAMGALKRRIFNGGVALFFVLAACGRARGALPEITFTEDAARCELRAEGCRWARSEAGKDELRCRVTKGGATWVKALLWTVYDDRGRKVQEGGAGGLPWKGVGESREVAFEVGASARDRAARIEVGVM